MLEYFKQILTSQFEAALCMMNQCIAACPPEHWEGKIANGTLCWVAYHTLFFVDVYLSPSEHDFTLRELHARGGDERGPEMTTGLSKEETLAYVVICREKMLATIAAATSESLAGDCGFSRLRLSRGELHLYNIRHVQHHAGQLSAYLRRVDAAVKDDPRALPWVRAGWRDAPAAR